MKTDQHTTLFESERPRLTAMAYRMLGRWTEAEDIVQDAFLRWQVADHAALQSPQAWLTTVVTRLSIDRIRRNRASREVYVGPWLPEPVLTPEGGERTDTGIETLASDLSLGLLHVLERLGPEERAAFILREAFDASYADIASRRWARANRPSGRSSRGPARACARRGPASSHARKSISAC
jgi:RNA polymerase sigma-70 factor (ECF subfamily)